MVDNDDRILKRIEELAISIQAGFDMLSAQIEEHVSALTIELRQSFGPVDRFENLDTSLVQPDANVACLDSALPAILRP